MSKNTASAARGAMPGRKPNPTTMADQIDVIKALVDAAFMAANALEDYQRGAMRGLLDETSSKIGGVYREFTEMYCGGYVQSDPQGIDPLLRFAESLDDVRASIRAGCLDDAAEKLDAARAALAAAKSAEYAR